MAKTKKQKEITVKTLSDSIKNAKSVVFANFQGLKVSEAEDLRKTARENEVEVLVAKKTLVKRAYNEAGLGEIDTKAFDGGVVTFLGKNDEVISAKIVNDFAKSHEVVRIFGGVLEGKYVDETVVKSLASLPGKDELLAKLVGSINAPVSGFVNVLGGNMRNLVGVLNAVKESKI